MRDASQVGQAGGVNQCGVGGGEKPNIDMVVRKGQTGLGRPAFDMKFTNNERQPLYITIVAIEGSQGARCGQGDPDTLQRDVRIEPGKTYKTQIPADGNGAQYGGAFRIDVYTAKNVRIGELAGNFPAKKDCSCG